MSASSPARLYWSSTSARQSTTSDSRLGSRRSDSAPAVASPRTRRPITAVLPEPVGAEIRAGQRLSWPDRTRDGMPSEWLVPVIDAREELVEMGDFEDHRVPGSSQADRTGRAVRRRDVGSRHCDYCRSPIRSPNVSVARPGWRTTPSWTCAQSDVPWVCRRWVSRTRTPRARASAASRAYLVLPRPWPPNWSRHSSATDNRAASSGSKPGRGPGTTLKSPAARLSRPAAGQPPPAPRTHARGQPESPGPDNPIRVMRRCVRLRSLPARAW